MPAGHPSVCNACVLRSGPAGVCHSEYMNAMQLHRMKGWAAFVQQRMTSCSVYCRLVVLRAKTHLLTASSNNVLQLLNGRKTTVYKSSQSSWLVCAQHHDHALGIHLISQQLAPVFITADCDLGSVSDPVLGGQKFCSRFQDSHTAYFGILQSFRTVKSR